ncbi:hypothetical protein JIR001_07100 [Polycladomyces abyssicola]|uniref:Uncharacterized protein n=1 Tax=Polycladomyces abyssicola TaxID=1125966 RepID=A0A8D5ZMJ5_9BACL|nr:hypothetical protein [Polycladomyces abyssicola]BCU80927.1 hypothetical protein JIR001_07100 [Polycladomyces abyssicola]
MKSGSRSIMSGSRFYVRPIIRLGIHHFLVILKNSTDEQVIFAAGNDVCRSDLSTAVHGCVGKELTGVRFFCTLIGNKTKGKMI